MRVLLKIFSPSIFSLLREKQMLVTERAVKKGFQKRAVQLQSFVGILQPPRKILETFSRIILHAVGLSLLQPSRAEIAFKLCIVRVRFARGCELNDGLIELPFGKIEV